MDGWHSAQLVLRVVLAVVFLFMGAMHFLPGPRRAMAAMIPPRLRFRGVLRPAGLVAATGVCELAGGIGLLFPATQLVAGVCLAAFLVTVFPANAYAASNPEKFGAFATPLLPRLFFQILLIVLCIIAVL